MSTEPGRKSEPRTTAARETRLLPPAPLISRIAPFACVGVLIAGLWLEGLKPRQLAHFGDDQEYLTMTQSFVRHASPEFREGDDTAMLDALPKSWRRSMARKFTPGRAPGAYYPSRSGSWYAFHFFTYSAIVAPLRAWLDGGTESARAHQLANLFVLSCALASLLLLGSQPRLFWVLTPVVFLTPVLWFTTYVATETFVYAMSVVALVCQLTGRKLLAILFNSIAATQYQPLAPLSVFLCAHWVWRERASFRSQVPRLLGGLLVTALVFAPGVFYFVHYGTPNLIAREGLAATRFVEFRKFAGLFIDLNGGMIAYTPGILAGLGVAAVAAAARLRQRDAWGVGLLGCILFTMLASTVQRNWNHPTFGVSRYVVYSIAPCLLFIGTELQRHIVDPRKLACACAIALGLQIWVQSESGWFVYRGNDSAHHSALASFVLERWPALYAPHPEIFCERTVGRCWQDAATGEPRPESLPALWRDSHGMVRKILAARCDGQKLLAAAAWTPAERVQLQTALRRCTGKGTFYIDL